MPFVSPASSAGTSGLSAAILAGGRASRFGGQDKSRLPVDGRPIIVRQLDVLQRISADVFIVANEQERFADLTVAVHADVVAGAGALGGILTAIERAQTDRVVVVACDLPFLDEGVLRRLAELAGNADGAWVEGPRGVEPLLACYRRPAAQPIRDAIARGALKAADLSRVVKMAPLGLDELSRYGVVDRLLTNVNTPDDYGRIELPRRS